MASSRLQVKLSASSNKGLLRFSFLPLLLLLQVSSVSTAAKCPSPPIPVNARVALSNETLAAGTSAAYACDDGYSVFGSTVLTCLDNGSWSGQTPFCGVNVAYRKPANQSTTVRGGDATNANDGNLATLHDGKYCSETRKEVSPWWRVDLLESYEIRTVRIIARKCCGGQPLQDVEIRVGNSSTLQKNRLCSWQAEPIEAGSTRDFHCARPIVGHFVFVQLVSVEGSLSLCEVQVFTTQEFSRERCANQSDPSHVASFNRKCYEVNVNSGANFDKARQYCRSRGGGDLVHRIRNATQNFLVGELERLKGQLSAQLLWIGAQKDPGSSRVWRWVTGEMITKPMWGDDQPNNYNGEQNCIVLDGGRGWMWNDVGCNLDYLLWVCEFMPPSCGSPDRQQNTSHAISGLQVGDSVFYSCPADSKLSGGRNRTCLPSGFWSGQAPTCKYVDCGPLSSIESGEVTVADNRTTYGAVALYTCIHNYTLGGTARRVCGENGRWDGDEPHCQFGVCSDPLNVLNATFELSGVRTGDNVTYTCSKGHKLEGQSSFTCLLGGKWSAPTPSCKYIDCGLPRSLPSISFQLPGNSTTLGSRVNYNCMDNHVLRGLKERVCEETGRWSGEEPTCEIISCGEPDVNAGSYVVGYEFTVGAVVEYYCDPGHSMRGDTKTRNCDPSGKWTGLAPKCKYIECGRVQPIPYAALDYLNETTHLGSWVSYECTSSYQLIGTATRVCQPDGRWNGTTPACREIRCTEPVRAVNTILSVSGNDRTGPGDTFKIGSTLQYRCEKGFRIVGKTLITCNAPGQWSHEPPTCDYVECPRPPPIENGQLVFEDNATFMGSTARYKCADKYELVGNAQRKCTETGTWSGSTPSCQEIKCTQPDRPQSVESIEVPNTAAGAVAVYKCSKGQRPSRNGTRVCGTDGRWSGTAPECHPVDCGRPPVIENGRVYLVDQATTYNKSIEYHCFPGYKLAGKERRFCREDGSWDDDEPSCQLDVGSNEVQGRHTATSGPTDNEHVASARNTGIAIGVGSGILLLVLIGGALLYMRIRASKPNGSEAPTAAAPKENVAYNHEDQLDGAADLPGYRTA